MLLIVQRKGAQKREKTEEIIRFEKRCVIISALRANGRVPTVVMRP